MNATSAGVYEDGRGRRIYEEDAIPTITDPGAAGWPDPPRVTPAERMLYGDLAATVRLFSQAAASTEDGYALACKTASEWEGFATDEDKEDFNAVIMAAWLAHEKVKDAVLAITSQVVSQRQRIAMKNREIGQPPGEPSHPPGE